MATSFSANKEGKAGDWKCIVVNQPWNDMVEVYLLNQVQRKIAVLSGEGTVILKEFVEGVNEPLMKLPYMAWQSILSAMGDVEPDIKKEVVDSELKATKYHLEDMRTLLKLSGLQPKRK